MKRSIIYSSFAVLVAFALLLFTFQQKKKPVCVSEASPSQANFDSELILNVLTSDGITKMNLKDYLIGVVCAEMPSTFPTEALKAQAVAARTFTLRQAEAKKHPNADICTNSACCQGWSAEQYHKAVYAVENTDGLIITYQNELIDATYFSCCGERTEAASSVWGANIPYLQSVESPDESDAPRYFDEVILDTDYFSNILTEAYPQMQLPQDPAQWLGKITYTRGGGIDTAVIGQCEVTGLALRKLFSLRSTDISITIAPSEVRIRTYGFGHRVGMSQYGAKSMAENGQTFDQILHHYYQNIELQHLYMEKTPLPQSEEA